MEMSNQSLIKFGVFVVVLFIIGFIIRIIMKLRGDAIKKEDIYEIFKQ